MMKKRKDDPGGKRKRFGVVEAGILLLFLVGLGILTYPVISDQWNRYRNSRLIDTYSRKIEAQPRRVLEDSWQEAVEYNRQHKQNVVYDVFEKDTEEYIKSHPYDELLDPLKNGVMGYLVIPKINLRLAIYHGTGKEALDQGCGHIRGTSLPVGGKGSHTVLSAHRGLPSAKLFTDLDQMKKKDVFYIHTLDRVLAYQVDQIQVVLPEETEALKLQEKEDRATLLTCTPYSINTHRLLVQGHRIPYKEPEKEEALAILHNRKLFLLAGGLGVFPLLAAGLGKRKKHRDSRKETGS